MRSNNSNILIQHIIEVDFTPIVVGAVACLDSRGYVPVLNLYIGAHQVKFYVEEA